MTTRTWGEEYRTTVVCLNPYENHTLCGRFYNPCLSEGRSFHSTVHFLLEIEQLLNTMEFPQPFTAPRSFADPPILATGLPPPDNLTGATITFALRISSGGMTADRAPSPGWRERRRKASDVHWN